MFVKKYIITSCFINQIILMMFTVLFQDNENFDTLVKKLSSESHLVSVDDSQDAVQVFVVVDNEVIMEIQYYIQVLFSICATIMFAIWNILTVLKCAFSF